MTAADPSRATPAAPAGGAVLLPCPFCGKKPTINRIRAGNCQLHGEKLYRHVVSCSDHATFSHPRSPEDAVALWNTRVALDPASHRTVAPDLGGSSGGSAAMAAHRVRNGAVGLLLVKERFEADSDMGGTMVSVRLTHLRDVAPALERLRTPAAPAAGGVAGVPTVEVMAQRIRTAVEDETGGLEIGYIESVEVARYTLTGLPPGPDRDAAVACLAEPRAGAELPPLSDAAAGLPDGLMLRSNAIVGAAVPQAAGGDRAVMLGVAVQSMVAALAWDGGPSRDADARKAASDNSASDTPFQPPKSERSSALSDAKMSKADSDAPTFSPRLEAAWRADREAQAAAHEPNSDDEGALSGLERLDAAAEAGWALRRAIRDDAAVLREAARAYLAVIDEPVPGIECSTHFADLDAHKMRVSAARLKLRAALATAGGDGSAGGTSDLVTALRDMRRRFHAALVASGTDPEFADIACEQADAALAKADGGRP